MNIPARENGSELKDQYEWASKKAKVRGRQVGALAQRTLWPRVRAWI